MNLQFTPKVVAAISAVCIALILLVGWFGFVSPQHSKAKNLDGQISDATEQLTVAQLLANSFKSGKGKAGALLLTTAMPPDLQMPLVLRQVQRLAERSNVRLDSFAPSTSTPLGGYDAVPIEVSVSGRYAAVQKFLHKVRTQAGTSNGRIHASGRLFDVTDVGLRPGGDDAPELTASLQLTTFVYTGVPLPTLTTTTSSSSTDGTTS